MHNWYAIESEADFRRHEWERVAAADALVALAGAGGIWLDWLKLPRFSLPSLNLNLNLNLKGFAAASRLSFAGPAPIRQTVECSC